MQLLKDKLQNIKGNDSQYTARCPAHDDQKNSLMFKKDPNTEKILLHCQAGCDLESILSATGLEKKDLFEHLESEQKIRYNYRDEKGEVLYYKTRYTGKGFSFYGYKPEDKTLYRLPELLSSQDTIYIVEGEKDCDNLRDLGLTATTAGGATSWEKSFRKYFKDRVVILLGDNDEAGRKMIAQIEKDLKNIVKSLRIIWSPVGKDISDYIISLKGISREEIRRLILAIKPDDTLSLSMFATNEKGRILLTKSNIERLLNYNGTPVYYDIIKKNVFINVNSEARSVVDTDIIAIISQFGALNNNFSKTSIHDFVDYIAEDNKINPVQVYLEQQYNKYLQDFEKDHIKELYECLELVNTHKMSYTLFRRWFVQAARIGCNNNGQYNAENILILQGDQGIRKTTFLRNLSPREGWMKDGRKLDPDSKDSVYEACAFWLVELGELDATMKSEQSRLKAFFSESLDKMRLPFDRRPIELPRTTAFMASVNKESFLKDETGSRRWWIFECKSIDIDKQKKVNIDRLWGYAYYLWKHEKELWYVSEQEYKDHLQKANEKFNINTNDILQFITDYGIEKIIDQPTDSVYSSYLAYSSSGMKKITFSKEICRILNIKTKPKTQNNMVFRIYTLD